MTISKLLIGIPMLLCLVAPSIAQSETWMLDSRHVPVPAGASPALQQIIGSNPAPSVAALADVPDDPKSFLDFIAAYDQRWLATLPGLHEKFPVEVKPDRIADVPVHHVSSKSILKKNRDRLFVYLHGGADVLGQGDGSIAEAMIITNRIAIPVLSIDYQMPPSAPFPAAVEDVIAVYREIIQQHAPQSIALGGTSAGGGLALSAVRKMQELRLPLPGAIYAGSPWADLTPSGDTIHTLAGIDRVLVGYDGLLENSALMYAGADDLKNPYISPLYGKFNGYPPTILFSGTRDLLLSDTVRTHRKLRAAGVEAQLHVFEGLSHAGYLIAPDLPESIEVYRELGLFIDEHLR